MYIWKLEKYCRLCNFDNYLNHANTRSNINKKIGIQIILINLHKLLLITHIGKCFLVNHLLKVDQDMRSSVKKFSRCIIENEDLTTSLQQTEGRVYEQSPLHRSKEQQNGIPVAFPYNYLIVKGIWKCHIP